MNSLLVSWCGIALAGAVTRLVTLAAALVASSVARWGRACRGLVAWLAAVEAAALALTTLAVLALGCSALHGGVRAVGTDVSDLAAVVACPPLVHRCILGLC